MTSKNGGCHSLGSQSSSVMTVYLETARRPSSGSILNWSVIYESRGEPDLGTQFAAKTFACAKTDYFRFIRYEQISNYAKKAEHANVINLDAIEFYGHCTVL